MIEKGKTIYFSAEELKWLWDTLHPLSENDPYWDNKNGFKDMMDKVCDKINP